ASAALRGAMGVGGVSVEFAVPAARNGTLVVGHDRPGRRHDYPTLEEVLDVVVGRIGVMVELKHPYLYRRHDVVQRTLALVDDDAVIICFEAGALRTIRRLRPKLRTLQHVGFGVTLRRAAGAWAVGFSNERVTPRALARAHAAGFETTVYTVNEPQRMLELASLGVSGIFTDCPDRARTTLDHPSA